MCEILPSVLERAISRCFFPGQLERLLTSDEIIKYICDCADITVVPLKGGSQLHRNRRKELGHRMCMVAPVLGPGGGFYAHTVRVLTLSSHLK